MVIINNVILYLSFFGLIFSALFTIKPKSSLIKALGFVFLIAFLLLTYLEFNPIDTTTKPIDLATIKIGTSGKKLTVRQYKNAKTNRNILDTVLVNDQYIFRRIYR